MDHSLGLPSGTTKRTFRKETLEKTNIPHCDTTSVAFGSEIAPFIPMSESVFMNTFAMRNYTLSD